MASTQHNNNNSKKNDYLFNEQLVGASYVQALF